MNPDEPESLDFLSSFDGSPRHTFKGTAAPHSCNRDSTTWLCSVVVVPSLLLLLLLLPIISSCNESTNNLVTFSMTSSGKFSWGALYFLANCAVDMIVQTSKLLLFLSSSSSLSLLYVVVGYLLV